MAKKKLKKAKKGMKPGMMQMAKKMGLASAQTPPMSGTKAIY